MNTWGYALNSPIMIIDPYGLFVLNLLKPGTPEHKHAARIKDDPSKAIVIAHGDYNGNLIGPEGALMSPYVLAEKLKSHPEWGGGMPVELRVCSAGYGEESIVDGLSKEIPDSDIRGPYGNIEPGGTTFWPYVPKWGFWPTNDAGADAWKTIQKQSQ